MLWDKCNNPGYLCKLSSSIPSCRSCVSSCHVNYLYVVLHHTHIKPPLWPCSFPLAWYLCLDLSPNTPQNSSAQSIPSPSRLHHFVSDSSNLRGLSNNTHFLSCLYSSITSTFNSATSSSSLLSHRQCYRFLNIQHTSFLKLCPLQLFPSLSSSVLPSPNHSTYMVSLPPCKPSPSQSSLLLVHCCHISLLRPRNDFTSLPHLPLV